MGGRSNRTTETSNQVSNQTTTPTILNSGLSSGINQYLEGVNNFGQQDPNSLVAGPSQLQQQAFTGVGNFLNGGDWLTNFQNAASGANNVAAAGANTATSQGYDPALANNTQVGPLNTATATNTSAAGLMDGGLDQYLNPYQSQVTDAYSADFDRAAGQTRAAQAAQGAANGAFSGSRYGVQEAQTEGELSRARAGGLASILQNGFNTATSLANLDANRRQGTNDLNAQLGTNTSQFNTGQLNNGLLTQAGLDQNTTLANQGAQNAAGQFNANAYNTNQQFNAGQQDADLQRQLAASGLLGTLGSSLAGTQLQGLGLAGTLGGQQRDITQAQNTAGLSQLQAYGSLLGFDPSLLTGQTQSGTQSGTSTTNQTQNPGLLATIGQGAQTAGSLASLFALSDARLKKNIRLLKERPDGIHLYAYNFIWDDDDAEELQGVMAHEVAQIRPDAVSHIGPYLTVNYGAIDV